MIHNLYTIIILFTILRFSTSFKACNNYRGIGGMVPRKCLEFRCSETTSRTKQQMDDRRPHWHEYLPIAAGTCFGFPVDRLKVVEDGIYLEDSEDTLVHCLSHLTGFNTCYLTSTPMDMLCVCGRDQTGGYNLWFGANLDSWLGEGISAHQSGLPHSILRIPPDLA